MVYVCLLSVTVRWFIEKENNMAKRNDIKKILIIGSGPIISVRLLNLTMPAHRLALR